MRFLCRLFGHSWEPWGKQFDTPDGGVVVFQGVVCRRCGHHHLTMMAAGCSDEEFLRLVRWSEHFEATAAAAGGTIKTRIVRENDDE